MSLLLQPRHCLAALPLVLAGLVMTPRAAAQDDPTPIYPGAPGEDNRGDEAAMEVSVVDYAEADVRFVQGMIAHHAQALDMTALAAERAQSDAVRMLARRIEISQADEIALMQRWLADRGEDVPQVDGPDHHHGHHGHAHHGHDHHELMPGMLTPEQLADLATAEGEAFDRLFLELMIFHHEGALIMVDELFYSEGGGQNTTVFRFASHVDADQRTEIARMRAMLGASSHHHHHE